MQCGGGEYSLRVTAAAEANLGANLRRISGSVLWHPVLLGGFSNSSVAPYLSRSLQRGDAEQQEDAASQSPSASQSVCAAHVAAC